MRLFVADVANNGEVVARSEYDTEDVRPAHVGLFRELVERPVAARALSCRLADGDAGPLEVELHWLRSQDEAVATFLVDDARALSLFVVTSPYDPKCLPRHLHVLQRTIVGELRGTEYEPAFHLRDLSQRPLLVLAHWRGRDALTTRKLRYLARVLAAAFAGLDSVKAAVAALEVD